MCSFLFFFQILINNVVSMSTTYWRVKSSYENFVEFVISLAATGCNQLLAMKRRLSQVFWGKQIFENSKCLRFCRHNRSGRGQEKYFFYEASASRLSLKIVQDKLIKNYFLQHYRILPPFTLFYTCVCMYWKILLIFIKIGLS